MMQIEVTQDIKAPAERVWAIITDLPGSDQVLSGVLDVEVLSGGDQFGVGTRWRETRKMFGAKATEEMEVTAVDAGRSYDVVTESHGTRYATSMMVAPTGEGSSRLTMTFGGEPTTTVTKVLGSTLGRLMTGSTRKAIARDLADIAEAAESAPSNEAQPPAEK